MIPFFSPIPNKIDASVSGDSSSGLATLSFYIITLGFLVEVYYCYISWHTFDILVTPIIPLPKIWYFSDFWLWFNFPDIYPEFYSSPPWMILFMSGFWGWIDAGVGRLAAVAIFAVLWVSALTYSVYYIVNAHAPFNGGKLLWSFLIVMFSYPVSFNLERENVAGFVTAACLLGVIFYQEGKFSWSILCIALAANVKIIPLVFLTIPFIEHRWMLLAKYLMATVLLFLASFIIINLFFNPNYEFDTILEGLRQYYNSFIAGDHGVPWETSMFETVKAVLQITSSKGEYPHNVVAALDVYHIVVAIFTGAMVLSLYIKRPPFLHCCILLTCWFILAPDVMANYYLAVLFLPLALSIREGNKLYTALLSLALIPKWFYIPNILTPHMYLSPIMVLLIFLVCIIEIYKMPAYCKIAAAV